MALVVDSNAKVDIKSTKNEVIEDEHVHADTGGGGDAISMPWFVIFTEETIIKKCHEQYLVD